MISGKSSLHDDLISGFSSHDLSEPYTPYGYMEPVDGNKSHLPASFSDSAK